MERSDLFRYYLPYVFTHLAHPRFKHVYLPLNRKYKPLGIISTDWVKYEDFMEQALIFSRDPHTFKNVWLDDDGLYLYSDNPRSSNNYMLRLENLNKHEMIMMKNKQLVGN